MEGVGWWPLPVPCEAQRVVRRSHGFEAFPPRARGASLPLQAVPVLGTPHDRPDSCFIFTTVVERFGVRFPFPWTLAPSVAGGGSEAFNFSVFAGERQL